ncbi:MAG TPA: NADH-quinone oxidoreductase subunit J [Planctomycetota bacterium]|nr:NADH-quinone oxidoreductase subunit J [Planctomycetota bacterium]
MAASEILLNVLFYVFAAGAVGGAIAVAVSRNIVRSAFSLLAVLVSVAALYAMMKADFLAAVQVLVYIGGILVLIIFAVMLTHRITDVNVSNESVPGLAAACACVSLLVALVLIVWKLADGTFMADPFARQAEERVVRAGNVEMRLRQYQADGRTGLAAGGATHEDGVVAVVHVPRAPKEALAVAVKRVGAPEKEAVQAPLVDGTARVQWSRFPKDDPATEAPENGVRWEARLVGLAGSLGDWVPYGTGPGPDFVVYDGMTEPAARLLAGRYLFAFEVVSVLLLAALVGAAFLARKEVKA